MCTLRPLRLNSKRSVKKFKILKNFSIHLIVSETVCNSHIMMKARDNNILSFWSKIHKLNGEDEL